MDMLHYIKRWSDIKEKREEEGEREKQRAILVRRFQGLLEDYLCRRRTVILLIDWPKVRNK